MTQLSESKYCEILLEAGRDVEAFIDPGGQCRFISSAYETVTGYSREGLLHNPEHIFELIHPDDLPNVKKHIKEQVEHQIDQSELEFRIITRNSEIKWIQKEINRVLDDKGIFLGYRSRSKDISKRKKKEFELARSIEKQKFTLEMAQTFLHLGVEKEINASIIERICEFGGVDGMFLKFSESYVLGKRGQLLWDPNYKASEFNLVEELENLVQNGLHSLQQFHKCILNKNGQSLFAYVFFVTYKEDLIAWGAFFHHDKEVIEAEIPLAKTLLQIYESTISLHFANWKLSENETKLKLALSNAQEGVWDWDIEKDRIYLHDSWVKVFGRKIQISPDSFKKLKGIMHPDDLQDFLKGMSNCLDGSTSEFDTEFRLQTLEGDWIWLDVKGIIIERDPEGKPKRMLGIDRDISRQKVIENQLVEYQTNLEGLVETRSKELRKSEIYYETMIENLPVMMCRWKEDSTITYANEVCANFFCMTREEIIGVKWGDLLQASTEESRKEQMDFFKSGKNLWIETTLEKDKNGTPLWVEWHDFPIFDEQGLVLEYQSIGVEVTKYKETQIALLAAKEKAESSDRMKTDFLNNVSHELRTPLNAVIGFSELINEDLPVGQIVEFSQYINQSGNRLLEIVNNIINVSLIEAEELDFKKSSFSLNQFMDEMYNRYFTHPKIVDHQLKLNVINDLQESGDVVCCDRELLKKVFDMLLDNALKFTESGQIAFGYRHIGTQAIEFYVKDTGVGIAPEFQEIIFNRFHQADNSTTREYGGLGIGLYISRKIVGQMGGTILVESESGCGSEFRFSIPGIINT